MDRDYCPFDNNMVPALNNFPGIRKQSCLLHCSPLRGLNKNRHCLSLKLGMKQIDISFVDRGSFCIFLAERSCMINMSLASSVRAKTSSLRFQSSRVNREKLMKLKDDDQESILTLRNYGVCHKNKGNFEEARNLLQKAERVAEIELDEDHKWKVMVKTDQAFLYKEKGKIGQMEVVMKEGLQMCYRFGQTFEKNWATTYGKL